MLLNGESFADMIDCDSLKVCVSSVHKSAKNNNSTNISPIRTSSNSSITYIVYILHLNRAHLAKHYN